MTTFDLAETDKLLTTTRAVRKRLDFDRDVPDDVLVECIRISQQAPSASNSQHWRWLIVRDQDKKNALADLYRGVGGEYLKAAAASTAPGQMGRVANSAGFLAERLQDAPALVIPCLKGRVEGTHIASWSSTLGSIYPAIWSFQLALRARELGSCLTTIHLGAEAEAAKVLGIPDTVTQVALLPVAYTTGTDFKLADRPDPETIIHWDTWGDKRS